MISGKRFTLDSTDLTIISMLSKNSEVSQEEIAKGVDLSQPAVGMRIRKLKDQGILSNQYGLNLQKAGLYLGKVDIITRNTKDILKKFEHCPLFLNGFVSSGKNNLCIFIIAEDLSSIQSIIDHHFKVDPTIEKIEESIIISASKQILYLTEFIGEKTLNGPCGSSCETCSNYISGDCRGCPITTSYKGKFWK